MRTRKPKRRVTLALNHDETKWLVSFVDRQPRQHRTAAVFDFPGHDRETVEKWIADSRDLQLVEDLGPEPETTADYFRASQTPGNPAFVPFGTYEDEREPIAA